MADSSQYDEATLARRYAMAQKLMEQGQQPVKHWAQGLANLANSALGGYEFSKAEDERRAEKAKGGADLYAALGLAAPAAAAEPSQGGFQRLAALLQGSPAPIAPGGDQASYPAPPAPSPTTFRPGITAPAAPPVAPPAPDYSKAIAGIESGGAYDKLGPVTQTGDRAFGKYQVMGNNVPEWTTQVLGKPMTPEQFLSNPEAQEAVFKAKFGDYVQKYGPEGAAKAWFAGEKGMNNPAGTDRIVRDGKVVHPGLSVAQYGQKFTQAFGPQAAPQIASALTSPDAALPPGATPAQGALPTAEAVAPKGILADVPQDKKLQIAQMLTSTNPTVKAMGMSMIQQMTKPETTDEIKEYNLAKKQGFPGSFFEFKSGLKKAGAVNVTTNIEKPELAFDTKAGQLQAERFNDLASDGQTAKQMISDIQTLTDLGKNIGTGKGAEFKAAIGPYAENLGIKIEGLSDIQAYEAVVNRIAPNLRVKGSGAQSDLELKNFLKSLPSLGNTPEGNEIASSVLTGLQENKISAAEIGSKALTKEITRSDAEKQLRDLPDPMTKYREYMKANRGAPTAAGAKTAPAIPQSGEIRDGYRFKGGNPADQKNWEQIS